MIAFARIQSRPAGALPARLAVDSVDYDDRTLEQERVDTRGLRRLLTSYTDKIKPKLLFEARAVCNVWVWREA